MLQQYNRPSNSALTLPNSSLRFEDFAQALLGTKSNGERFAYFAGQRRCKDVCVFLNVILDNSGSMLASCGNGKSRLEVAFECLNGIVKSQDLSLAAPDSLVVHTFNKDVKIRLCCHPNNYDHGKLIDRVNKDFGDKSGTRMRDAIFDALENMEKHKEKTRKDYHDGVRKEVVRYLLVLTDGADAGSTNSVDALVARLNRAEARLKNMHLLVIAAGLGPRALADLNRLCNSRVPVKVIEVTTVSDVNIKKAFNEAMDELRMLLFKRTDGSVNIAQYAGRDRSRVANMDRGAAAVLGTCDNVRVLSTEEHVLALAREMGNLLLLSNGQGGTPQQAIRRF